MINLEVWVPNTYDLVDHYVPGCLHECGAVRKPGYFGWFIPKDNDLPDYIHYSKFRQREFTSTYDITEPELQEYILNRTIEIDRSV